MSSKVICNTMQKLFVSVGVEVRGDMTGGLRTGE